MFQKINGLKLRLQFAMLFSKKISKTWPTNTMGFNLGISFYLGGFFVKSLVGPSTRRTEMGTIQFAALFHPDVLPHRHLHVAEVKFFIRLGPVIGRLEVLVRQFQSFFFRKEEFFFLIPVQLNTEIFITEILLFK